jgi:DNA-binding transcriptional MocR family regulator
MVVNPHVSAPSELHGATDNRAPIDMVWLADQVREASARGIAATVTRLVRHGEIPTGSRMPAVRDLAVVLRVSPATVSSAWGLLRSQNVIEGRGRQGSWIVDVIRSPRPKRFETIGTYWSKDVLDLSLAIPDPALLPDLDEALARSVRGANFNTYEREVIAPALADAARAEWPFVPEALLVTNGGYEGLRLLLSSMLVPGDYVAVADPSAPRLLDILEHVGARILPVMMDAQGPVAASLRRAMSHQPVIFLYEPRASSRLGITVTPQRRDELVAILRGTETVVVEDDGVGDIAMGTYSGVGAVLPEQTVLVKSYSKSHGPDLRIAIVGGRQESVERARAILQFGAAWTSRVLQDALAVMLVDDAVTAQIDAAREVYRARRDAMIERLMARGVTVIGGNDGLSLAVRVVNEHQALLVLASHGIAADAISTASVASPIPMVRLGIGLELERPDFVADAYALASRAV